MTVTKNRSVFLSLLQLPFDAQSKASLCSFSLPISLEVIDINLASSGGRVQILRPFSLIQRMKEKFCFALQLAEIENQRTECVICRLPVALAIFLTLLSQ